MKKLVFALIMSALLASTRAAEVKVFAAISLSDALRAMQDSYARASGDTLTFNFNGSNVLALQLTNGAPADVFFSADEAQMDKLAQAKLIDPATRKDIVYNRLVVIVPLDSKLKINSLADLAQPKVKKLALADPRSVPAGVYAKEFLEQEKVWDKVADRVVPGENVRAAVAAVEGGNVQAGIVYATDIGGNTEVKLAFRLPDSTTIPIAFPVAVVHGAAQPEAAAKFVKYLQTENARAILSRYGFIVRAIPDGK